MNSKLGNIRLFIYAFLTLPIFVSYAAADGPCVSVTLSAEISVAAGPLSLAEVLPADTCPSLRRAAVHVSLGAAPRAGSARFLQGTDLRFKLEQLTAPAGDNKRPSINFVIPVRVRLTVSGARLSCREISQRLRAFLEKQASAVSQAQTLECAVDGNIPQSAALELSAVSWNAASRRWEYLLRCHEPRDCVPFRVRSAERANEALSYFGMPSASLPDNIAEPRSKAGPSAIARSISAPESALVHRGQSALLLWDQYGIRSTVPVICLEPGGAGDSILVRIKNGNRILQAQVESAGRLRVKV